MSLADVVAVNISSASASPTQAGFGTALLCGYHTVGGSARVRVYPAATAVASMTTDGMPPALLAMATLVLSQNPAPTRIKVGRRANAFTQTFTLKCLSATAGDVYSVTVGTTAISYTVPSSGSPTTSTVGTAIAALIAAVSGVASAVSVTGTITVTATTAGALLNVKSWCNLFEFAATTADPGLAADLAAIAAEDNDWYGLVIDTPSPANITTAAAYVEANEKILATHTNDTQCGNPASTTDIMYTQKALAHARTYLQFNGKDNYSYAGAAMLGSRLPQAPGSDTWNGKTQSGITVDDAQSLTATQEAAILAKNGNVYTTLANVNVTRNGKSPAGEYLDVVRGRDWLKATIQTRTFAYLISGQKVPYTDLGTDALATVGVRSSLAEAVRVGFLAADPAPVVTVLPVAQVSSIDKAARTYGGISWTATLAGAIHAVTITGTVGV